MIKTIIIIILLDLIGKFLYVYPQIVVFTLSIATVGSLFLLTKRLFQSKYLRYFKQKFNFVYSLVLVAGSLVLLLIAMVTFYGLLMTFRQSISVEWLNFLQILLVFLSYLSLALNIFYLLFRANDFLLKKKNKMQIIIIAVLFMLIGDVIAALLFYHDGYYNYKANYFNTKISEINQNTDQSYINTVFSEIVTLDNSNEIPRDYSLFILELLKHKINSADIHLEKNLVQEINEFAITSTDKIKSLPSLTLFIKLFKFSFYQHYVLGLDDDLSNFQKFIASNIYISINQMVHMLFVKLIDLILIGKFVTILTGSHSLMVVKPFKAKR